jgi:hypothetical protein
MVRRRARLGLPKAGWLRPSRCDLRWVEPWRLMSVFPDEAGSAGW